MPEGKDETFVRDILLCSVEKGCGVSQVLTQIETQKGRGSDAVDRMKTNEVLWRVDERMRPELEKQSQGSHAKVQDKIVAETLTILKDEEAIKKGLERGNGVTGETLDRLTTQVIKYRAQHGKEPSKYEMELMKGTITCIGEIENPSSETEQKVHSYAVDKSLNKACDISIQKGGIQKVDIDTFKQEIASSTSQIKENIRRDEHLQNSFQQHQKPTKVLGREL